MFGVLYRDNYDTFDLTILIISITVATITFAIDVATIDRDKSPKVGPFVYTPNQLKHSVTRVVDNIRLQIAAI